MDGCSAAAAPTISTVPGSHAGSPAREQGAGQLSSPLFSSLLLPSPPLLCGWLSPSRLCCPAPASLPCRGLFLRPLCPPARLLAENNLQKDRLIPRSGVGATQSAPEPLMSCAHRAGEEQEELQPEPRAGAAGPGALGGAEPLCPLPTGHVNRRHRRCRRPPPPPRAPGKSRRHPGTAAAARLPASLRAPRQWSRGPCRGKLPPLRCLRAVPARRYHREGQSRQHKLLPRRSRAPEGLLYSETLGAVHSSIPGCSRCHRPSFHLLCLANSRDLRWLPGTAAPGTGPAGTRPRGSSGPRVHLDLQANSDPYQTTGADKLCYVIDMNHPAKMQIPLLARLPA
ncbi:uncharacterized protein [Aphelocoma coerulescens]|uniref:uncharacterized protein n=1 Tax=Aphelocoma coerulescens TaxID=39617 RepID=UPI00360448D6